MLIAPFPTGAGHNKKQGLLKNSLNKNLKKTMVKLFAWSVLLYASQTWRLTAEDIQRIEAMEMWIWRRIAKIYIYYYAIWQQSTINQINWTDRISNEVNLTRERQARWIGHVMRGATLLKDMLAGRKKGSSK